MHAIRALRKHRRLTLVAVVTIALTIGANAAIFTLVDGLLLKSLPYREPEGLVMIYGVHPESARNQEQLSSAEFLDWRDRSGIFEQVVAFAPWLFTATGPGEPEMIHAYLVTPGLFDMLGVKPLLGRLFSPDEEVPGQGRVIVLRHSLWQSRYGGDPNALGQKLLIEGEPYTIIGVMPPAFQFFNRQSEVLMPMGLDPQKDVDRNYRSFRVMARLEAGLSLPQAQARAEVFSQQLAREFPQYHRGWKVQLVTLPEDTAGAVRHALLVLLGAVGFVLLIACANVANLMLVQATARAKEIALRAALGAGRWRIAREFLAGSLLLALAGGVAGLGLGWILVRYFQSLLPAPTSFGRYLIQMDQIRLDWRVVAFTFLVTLVAGLAFGTLPAWRAARPDLNEALKSAGAGSAGGRGSAKLRDLLACGEIVLAVVLLVGAGLLIQSFLNLYKTGPGFRADNVLTVVTRFPWKQYRELQKRRLLNEQLLERLRGIPGVKSSAAASNLPLHDWFHPAQFTVEGRSEVAQARVRNVTPDFFRAMGMPLVRGRVFTPQDTPELPPVTIIDEPLARRYFPSEDPVGKRLKLGRPEGKSPWTTVVGVVGGTRDDGMDKEPYPVLYVSASQQPMLYMTLLIHTESDPIGIAPAVQHELRALDPGAPIYRVWKLEDVVRDSTWRTRYAMILLAGLAALSLALALVGVYGVVRYSVAQRTQEIGIRMALGAQAGDVRRLVTRHVLRLAAAGVTVGLLGAMALARLLSSQLYGVGSIDPLTFVLVAALLTATALAAGYFPARRATRVDPITALRYE